MHGGIYGRGWWIPESFWSVFKWKWCPNCQRIQIGHKLWNHERRHTKNLFPPRLTLILDNLLLAWSNTLEASRCNRLSRFHLKFMKTCFAFLWLQNTCHYFWRWLYMLPIFVDAFSQGFACTPLLKCRFDETISNGMNIRFIYLLRPVFYHKTQMIQYRWYCLSTRSNQKNRTLAHIAHIGLWYLNFTHKFFRPYTIGMAQFWTDTLFQSQN